jgi:hypothetical protein
MIRRMLGGSSDGGDIVGASCPGVAAAASSVVGSPPSLDVTIIENSELASKLNTRKSPATVANRKRFSFSK